MKRLRHPIRAIREPFGTAGLIVACLALVLAMGGAAVAAKGGLTGKQKTEVEKIAKKYAGKPGANGSNGATGPAGAKGEAGAPGANGTSGTNGVSAEATSFTGSKTLGSTTCTEGGLVVKSSSGESLVCNGKKGTTGFTKTLPVNATETGIWGQSGGMHEFENFFPISFPIPLAAAPHLVYVGPTEESKPGCPGRGGGTFPTQPGEQYVPTTPEAESGNLCVYADLVGGHVLVSSSPRHFGNEEGGWSLFAGAAMPNGTYIEAECTSTESQCATSEVLMGTWAVTG